MGTNDENLLWLLSTTAQSSAALVAIIAGFLLSRVLAVSSFRSSLVQEMARVQVEQDGLIEDSDRIHASTLSLGKSYLSQNTRLHLLQPGVRFLQNSRE